MKCGLLGERLNYSFSAEIHESLGRYSYSLIELAPKDLEAFLSAKDFDGINVTIPYKEAVIPYLDEISARAKAIGAVNTIVNRNGKLFGDNTDFAGMKGQLKRMGLDPAGKTVLIAGSGGTAKTAAAVLETLGASVIRKMSRSKKDGSITYEEAYERVADAGILINTTPVGTFPDLWGIPVDLNKLPCLTGILDVVYNPLTTRLVREGKKRGIAAENGLYMLTAQAVYAAEAFTKERFGEEEIERIFRQVRAKKENLVLIGMPGSGKSTVAKLLAERLGRPRTDTDEVIVERIGMPIADYFRKKGEERFRDLESEVIRGLSATGGGVIATGGGAVLREENADALKANGRLIYLDCPPERLLPTDNRPLSDSREKIDALYRERLPIYRSAADLVLPVGERPEETVNKLLEMLQ